MNRFEKVIQILDKGVGGPTAPVGFHGAFWRGVTRNDFVAKAIFGLPLITVGNGAGSNLVKALKGEAPFGADLPNRTPTSTACRPDAGRCGGYRVHSKVDRRRLSGGRGGYPRARHTIAMAQDQRAAGPAPRRRLVRRSDDRMGGEQRRQYHQDHQRRRELDGAALVTRRVSALHRLCESVDRLGGNTDPAATAISYDGRRRQLVQRNGSARQCAGQRVRPLGR